MVIPHFPMPVRPWISKKMSVPTGYLVANIESLLACKAFSKIFIQNPDFSSYAGFGTPF
jgi:hypothetical protein